MLIAIAVSSNLQGAATLVGDTTSILLGGFAGMNFFDFFWMEGRPGIFLECGAGSAGLSGVLLFWLFRRRDASPSHATVETEVEDDVPTAPHAADGGSAHRGVLPARSLLAACSHLLYDLRSGLDLHGAVPVRCRSAPACAQPLA